MLIEIGYVFHLKESIDKKLCHMQILAVKGVGGLGESVKKGRSVMKMFSQKILDEVLKSCKK